MGLFDRLRDLLRRLTGKGRRRPKSVLGLEIDSPFVIVDAGDGVAQVLSKDAYDYLYGSESVPAPSQATLNEALEDVTRVRVLAGGMLRGKALGGEELIDTHDAEAVANLRESLRIHEAPDTFGHCMCLGGPTLELYGGDELRATIGVHHGHSIRWREWKHDARVRNSGLLERWLSDQGIDPNILRAIFDGKYDGGLPCSAPQSPEENRALNLVRRAYLERLQGKQQTAIDLCTEALEALSELAVAHVVRGLAYQSLDEHEDAIGDFTGAVDLGDKTALLLASRAMSFYASGDLQSALSDCSRAIELEPRCADAYSTRAIVCMRLGRIAEAVADSQEVVELLPHTAGAHSNLGMAQLAAGDSDAALASLEKAIELEPRNPAFRLNRARARVARKELETALDDLDTALEFDPDFTPAIIERARVREEAGDLPGAESDYERAAELVPEENGIAKIRASSRHSRGDHTGAVEILDQAVEESPGDLDLYALRAHAHWYGGQLDESIADFTKVLTDGPGRLDALLGRGQALAEKGEFEAALEDTEESVTMARELGEPEALAYSLGGRGAALAGMGRLEEALDDFAESEGICPENAWLYYRRAVAYARAERFDEATVDFRKALELDCPPLLDRQRRTTLEFLAKCEGSQS